MNINNIELFHDVLSPMIRRGYKCHTVLFGTRAWKRLVFMDGVPIPERVWMGHPALELIESHTMPAESALLIGTGPAGGFWTHHIPTWRNDRSRGRSIPEETRKA